MHRLDLGLYSHPKYCGGTVRTHVNPKGKIPFTGSSDKDQTHTTALHRTASPTQYQLSYSGPTAVVKSNISIHQPDMNKIMYWDRHTVGSSLKM